MCGDNADLLYNPLGRTWLILLLAYTIIEFDDLMQKIGKILILSGYPLELYFLLQIARKPFVAEPVKQAENEK